MLFFQNGPRHWDAGLPVIPLHERAKNPILQGWQEFAERMPSEEERSDWLLRFPGANMGLPLGPCSGLMAVDIDTNDPTEIAAIERVLPASPWRRVGAKGCVLIFGYNGQPSTRIKDENGRTVVEILSRGTQIVLPPSIHPVTGNPYTANCDLSDLIAKAGRSLIAALPEATPLNIRGSLSDAGVRLSQGQTIKLTQHVPIGSRDNSLVAMAGLFAGAITRRERTLVDALEQITVWAKTFPEAAAGDCVQPEKAQQKLIEFLIKDVTQNGRVLWPGWDKGLSEKDKEALGVSELPETLLDARYDLNDTGNASRFADNYRDGVRYEVDTKTFRIWSGKHWAADATREIERYAQKVVQQIDREANLISDPLVKKKALGWAKRSGDRTRLVSMVNLAGTDPTIACASTNFDNVPGLLPVLNGIVDLTTGDLLPHSPDRLISKLVEFEYRPGAAAARFQSVLDRILPDPAVQTFFQRCLGYALHGNPVEQRFFVARGRGANGKSAVFDTIAEIVRPWVIKTSSSTFLQKDNEAATRPDLVRLQGSRIAIGSETPSRRKLDATIVKSLTGDRDITARPLYSPDKTFQRTFVPFMITNPLPPGDEADGALWRRLVLIPFDVTIPEEERDPDLIQSLLEHEAEGILAWLIAGAIDYAKQGLEIPQEIKERTAEWRRRVGSIERFLLESCTNSASSEVALPRLHEEYQRCCFGRSIHPLGIESLRQRLEELGYAFDDADDGETVIGLKHGKEKVPKIGMSQSRA